MHGNINIESINYKGTNIECKSPFCPSLGDWKDGDIVYNTGNSSCVMWIRINNGWVER